MYAMIKRGKKDICPFCREPGAGSQEEEVKRVKKLMEKGSALAYYSLAGFYSTGSVGLPRDLLKAKDLWIKAGELGCAGACYNLGNIYHGHGHIYGHGHDNGGVEINSKKANHYWELAAMKGDSMARYNLACNEQQRGNYDRAYKHCIISARAGNNDPMNNVRFGFKKGYITKDEYESTLREYQKRQDEVKSDARDEAARMIENRDRADEADRFMAAVTRGVPVNTAAAQVVMARNSNR